MPRTMRGRVFVGFGTIGREFAERLDKNLAQCFGAFEKTGGLAVAQAELFFYERKRGQGMFSQMEEIKEVTQGIFDQWHPTLYIAQFHSGGRVLIFSDSGCGSELQSEKLDKGFEIGKFLFARLAIHFAQRELPIRRVAAERLCLWRAVK